MLEKLFNLGNEFYLNISGIWNISHIWKTHCDMFYVTSWELVCIKFISKEFTLFCRNAVDHMFLVLIILSKILWAFYFVKYICTEHTPQYSHLCIIIDLKRHVGIYIWVLINLNPLIGETSSICKLSKLNHYSWTFYYSYHHYHYWQ